MQRVNRPGRVTPPRLRRGRSRRGRDRGTAEIPMHHSTGMHTFCSVMGLSGNHTENTYSPISSKWCPAVPVCRFSL